MELKLANLEEQNKRYELLIVPYGIETKAILLQILMVISLLIVPYGIETT